MHDEKMALFQKEKMKNGQYDVKSENGIKIDTLQIYLLNVTMFLFLSTHFDTLHIWEHCIQKMFLKSKPETRKVGSTSDEN